MFLGENHLFNPLTCWSLYKTKLLWARSDIPLKRMKIRSVDLFAMDHTNLHGDHLLLVNVKYTESWIREF